MYNGYDFYFKHGDDVLTFPITPSELNIKVGSNNKVVNLINEGDINILKSPSLIEIEFEARFPMRQYPYAREYTKFKTYYDFFKKLKTGKESFRFIVSRKNPDGKTRTWDTNILVALEEFELNESADEGDDVIVKFKLKQYKKYSVKKIKVVKNNSKTSTTSKNKATTTKTTRDSKSTKNSKTYTIKSGDCLWNIAKTQYGDGSKWKKIYDANKTVIENAAKKHGYKSSSNGHWIFPGTKITIPGE